MTRPMLFLDVDGVLNPYAAAICPDGFIEHEVFPGEEPIRVNAGHGHWVSELLGLMDVCWATGWNDNANELLAPLLGLAAFPVVRMPVPFRPAEKVARIAAHAGQRPAAWIDDIHTPEAYAWASERTAPTLLVTTDPAIGLTRESIERVLAWCAVETKNGPRGGPPPDSIFW